ncbi:MAG TPA: histidine--tRNA ligase [Dehalococcoidia bacterium]|nr:histidine--tRNA ligase [Dehalococcoidia bacterium]
MYQAPRGTSDVLPAEQPYWQHVSRTAERLCARYGYQRIDTPIFEDAGVFIHGTGESSDIVQREMYLFEDRDGGHTYALRPEFTPNVMRAYLEHGLFNQPQPVKLWTVGPAFRHERPQAGRTRQFHQLDLEAIGEADPAIDAELIDYLWQLFAELGLRDLTVLLNSIGDQNCRPQYVQLLRAYYADKLDRVCADDRVRFEKNPLRLLDCKVPSCQPIIAGAPVIAEHLCEPCAEHFARVQRYLATLEIHFVVQPRLVRGLDYYTRTVFEFVPEGAGSTGTIGAGGRYDGLMEVLGGPPTPGIGFATGIERIVLNLKKAGIEPPPLAGPEVFVAYPTDAQRDQAVLLAARLRHEGIGALAATGSRSLKAQMRHAGRAATRYAYIVGSGPGESQLRDLRAGSQQAVEPDDLIERMREAAK